MQYGTAFAVALVVTCAAANAQEKKDGKGEGNAAHTEGVTMVYVQPTMQGAGTNRSVIVGEDELARGFQEKLKRHAECSRRLLELFDKDRDGKLNDGEAQAARRFVFGIFGTMRYDGNGDWEVDEPETDRLWERLSEGYQRHNDIMLKKFDENGDGTLGEDEREKAQEAMRQWRKKGGR